MTISNIGDKQISQSAGHLCLWSLKARGAAAAFLIPIIAINLYDGGRGTCLRGYYEALQSITSEESLDITSWIEWFLDRLGNAVGEALLTLDNVMLKNNFGQAHAASELHSRQAKVINRLLEGNFQGKLTSTKWAKLTNASQETASHDIADLIEKGVLQKGEAGGRSTAYELVLNYSAKHPPQRG
ncbi:hypothetical protein [Agrobacterium tumefaciens]|uniref:hypothetical protein n=1 Tax=Agrobacterium tumefaciens TaxID=358 RepID=UPI0021CF9C8E|nr:hypothetical protein [Agrobacterium tumefaciens]UXS05407.1 hypothetical protein FY156_28030 [Agrobacterium tumefaciens]